MRTVQVWRHDRLFWFAYAKPVAKVLRWHPPKCFAMEAGKWKRSHVFACQYGVRTVHFTHTLFTQYQITLRDAALRDASFRLCANRLSTCDTPELSGVNSSDVRGTSFTLIELYVDEEQTCRRLSRVYSASLSHTTIAELINFLCCVNHCFYVTNRILWEKRPRRVVKVKRQ